MELQCNSIALTGIARDCSPNMGGIKKVWFALRSAVDVDNIVITVPTGSNLEDIDGTITSIPMVSGSTESFYEFNFRKGAASFTSNLQKDDTAGSYFWETDLTMNFQRMETAKRTAIMALTLAESVAIVLDNNDKYWFLGKDEYLGATAGTGETGTAKTDANQYTITVQDNSLQLPFEVTEEAFKALPIYNPGA